MKKTIISLSILISCFMSSIIIQAADDPEEYTCDWEGYHRVASIGTNGEKNTSLAANLKLPTQGGVRSTDKYYVVQWKHSWISENSNHQRYLHVRADGADTDYYVNDNDPEDTHKYHPGVTYSWPNAPSGYEENDGVSYEYRVNYWCPKMINQIDKSYALTLAVNDSGRCNVADNITKYASMQIKVVGGYRMGPLPSGEIQSKPEHIFSTSTWHHHDELASTVGGVTQRWGRAVNYQDKDEQSGNSPRGLIDPSNYNPSWHLVNDTVDTHNVSWVGSPSGGDTGIHGMDIPIMSTDNTPTQWIASLYVDDGGTLELYNDPNVIVDFYELPVYRDCLARDIANKVQLNSCIPVLDYPNCGATAHHAWNNDASDRTVACNWKPYKGKIFEILPTDDLMDIRTMKILFEVGIQPYDRTGVFCYGTDTSKSHINTCSQTDTDQTWEMNGLRRTFHPSTVLAQIEKRIEYIEQYGLYEHWAIYYYE